VTRAARIVPDVPSFAVDRGFWYSIPEHLEADLVVGSIVRVPLSGRRVRGWVVEIGSHDMARLKDVAAISGSLPVFDAEMFRALEWAAAHYVAPLSSLLTKASPPNLPKSTTGLRAPAGVSSTHPMAGLAARAATGRKAPTTALIGNWRSLDWVEALSPTLSAGRSVLAVVATVAEVRLVTEAARSIRGLVGAVSGEDDAEDTRAWEKAQTAPCMLIGTPRVAGWHVADLGLAVVLEESRRAMKDRQTPTVHVRELITVRSRIEGFNVVFFGPTPSVELLSAGADIIRTGNRAWPLVEIIDRSEDRPGAGFLSDRAFQAIARTVKSGGRVFVYTHRRAGSSAMRCSRCRTLRVCSGCGRRLGRVSECPSCGTTVGPCSNCGSTEFEELGTVPERLVAEMNRRAGSVIGGVHPSDSPVTVGTERDLSGLEVVDLAVAADVDGMLLGSGYRTTEDALRQLGRLALAVGSGRGARLILQTARPDSLLVTTMRRGDPMPYLERVLVERAREGVPPSVEMIAIEIRDTQPDSVGSDLSELDADVMGPVPIENGRRWLLTGDLGAVRPRLREMVGRWRDNGATVRVDVDPIDI
jgi:primosomal protein N' (replication factor Y)